MPAYRSLRSAGSVVQELVRKVDKLQSGHVEEASGIATGFDVFDKLTGGLRRGEVTLLAARPSVGKTAFAMHVTTQVATVQKLPVLVVSTSMSACDWTLMAVCSAVGCPPFHARSGLLSPDESLAFMAAASELEASPLYIDETLSLDANEVAMTARYMASTLGQHPCLVVVDGLENLVECVADNEENGLGAALLVLKAMSEELNCAVLVLTGLPSTKSLRRNERPRLVDFRSVGMLDRFSDSVIFLYQDSRSELLANQSIDIEILLAKQRHGAIGTIMMKFLRSQMRYVPA